PLERPTAGATWTSTRRRPSSRASSSRTRLVRGGPLHEPDVDEVEVTVLVDVRDGRRRVGREERSRTREGGLDRQPVDRVDRVVVVGVEFTLAERAEEVDQLLAVAHGQREEGGAGGARLAQVLVDRVGEVHATSVVE